MRILFLKQGFQPYSSFKGLPFAKAIRDRGHEVEVLTGFPNYPGGFHYEGYNMRPYKREVMDGITVHRVPHYPSHDKSAPHRIMTYISFALSCFLLGPWLVKKPDIIYVYNLITLGPPAFLLRLLYGAKVFIDVQDLWPESVAHSKMLRNKTALRILDSVCNWVYRGADQLAVLSPGFKEELTRRCVAAEKIEIIYNWCDEASIGKSALKAGPIKQNEFSGKFIVLFAGMMGVVQGLDTVLDSAGLCKESLPDVRFILIGGGVDRLHLQKRAIEMGLDNVTFLPPRPMETMWELFALSDALLVHLKDDPLFRITIPSKTQAYLYAGKPIIMAMFGNAAELVQDAGAGVLCRPNDPQEMMRAIKVLYEMPVIERQKMGEAGHRYYMQHLSLTHGINRFETIMTALSKRSRHGEK